MLTSDSNTDIASKMEGNMAVVTSHSDFYALRHDLGLHHQALQLPSQQKEDNLPGIRATAPVGASGPTAIAQTSQQKGQTSQLPAHMQVPQFPNIPTWEDDKMLLIGMMNDSDD